MIDTILKPVGYWLLTSTSLPTTASPRPPSPHPGRTGGIKQVSLSVSVRF